MRSSFARLAKVTLQDLRSNKKESVFFSKYTKEDIVSHLKSPQLREKQLRNAVNFIYGASSHFRRLVNYFAKMSLLSYIIVPYGVDTAKDNSKTFKAAYNKVVNITNTMNIPHEFQKVLTVAFRDDVFYGYVFETDQSFYIYQLPSDFCKIANIEDGVFNPAFDFQFFDSRQEMLEFYGDEFKSKYNAYKSDSKLRWQELDSNRSICIKVNEDILYPMPPFAGVLESLFDIEDFKALQKVKSELENTKLIHFKLPVDKEDNSIAMDDELRKKFYREINEQVPDQVGVVVSPFESDEYSFENNNVGLDTVSKSVNFFWSSAGVTELLFNSDKSSSAVMQYSIKSDFDIVCGVIRQIERWINRRLKYMESKHKFKISILDVNRYNQKEMFDMFYKAGQVGAPVKQAIAATLGYNPSDILNMSYLENEILEMRDTMYNEPLLTSTTMSPDSEGGAPEKDEPLTDEGQQTKDNDSNKNRA